MTDIWSHLEVKNIEDNYTFFFSCTKAWTIVRSKKSCPRGVDIKKESLSNPNELRATAASYIQSNKIGWPNQCSKFNTNNKIIVYMYMYICLQVNIDIFTYCYIYLFIYVYISRSLI